MKRLARSSHYKDRSGFLSCSCCHATTTPLWRKGPDGKKSLCNSCGTYYCVVQKLPRLTPPQSRIGSSHQREDSVTGSAYPRADDADDRAEGADGRVEGADGRAERTDRRAEGTDHRAEGADYRVEPGGSSIRPKTDQELNSGIKSEQGESCDHDDKPGDHERKSCNAESGDPNKLAEQGHSRDHDVGGSTFNSRPQEAWIAKHFRKMDEAYRKHCVHCDATSTPLWRRGPDGKKSLCNGCGTYYCVFQELPSIT